MSGDSLCRFLECPIRIHFINNNSQCHGKRPSRLLDTMVLEPRPCTIRVSGHHFNHQVHTTTTCHIPNNLEKVNSMGHPPTTCWCQSTICHRVQHIALIPAIWPEKNTTLRRNSMGLPKKACNIVHALSVCPWKTQRATLCRE
jgi:hypothetical protein